MEGRSTGDAALLEVERIGEAEQNPSWKYVFVTSSEEGSKLTQSFKEDAIPGVQTLVIARDLIQYQQIEAQLPESKRPVYYLNSTLSDWIKYHTAPASIASRSPIVIGSTQSHFTNIPSGKGAPAKPVANAL